MLANNFNLCSGPNIMMLRRKENGNPDDYFDKKFADYKTGFQSRGKYSVTHTNPWHPGQKMVS